MAGDPVFDGRVGGDVNLLQSAGDDRRVGVFLIRVYANALDAGLPCGLQRAEPAAARDLDHHIRPAVDLSLGDAFALGRDGEVIRVADEYLDPGIFPGGFPLAAVAVVVDRRAADAA